MEVKVKYVAQPKVLYLTVLNVLACFAVVALHCSNAAFWNYSDSLSWVMGNFVETLFYFAVPIFFMISGVTLMDYHERYDDKVFLKKRFQKTVIPFLFWSVIAYIYWVMTQNAGAFYRNPLRVFSEMLNTRYMGVYWFFLPLFAFYLSLPILTRIQDKLKTFRYAIIIGMIFVTIVPMVFQILQLEYNYALTPPPVTGYLLYAFLGYTLNKVELTKKQRWVIYVCGVLGWAIHFFGTWILSAQIGEIAGLFKGYLNLPCVMMSVAVFVAVKNFDIFRLARRLHMPRAKMVRLRMKFERVLEWFAQATFGIYLIHGYIVYPLPGLLGFSATNPIWRTVGAVVVFVVCTVLVRVLQKIPMFRRVLP